MVVKFLFFLFVRLILMSLQYLADSFEAIKLIFFRLDTLVFFPNGSRTYLTFFRNCSCWSHKFPIYLFFLKKSIILKLSIHKMTKNLNSLHFTTNFKIKKSHKIIDVIINFSQLYKSSSSFDFLAWTLLLGHLIWGPCCWFELLLLDCFAKLGSNFLLNC